MSKPAKKKILGLCNPTKPNKCFIKSLTSTCSCTNIRAQSVLEQVQNGGGYLDDTTSVAQKATNMERSAVGACGLAGSDSPVLVPGLR